MGYTKKKKKMYTPVPCTARKAGLKY